MADQAVDGGIVDKAVDTQAGREGGRIDSFGEAEAHDEGFTCGFERSERLFFDQAVAVAGDGGEEVLGFLVADGAQARSSAMCAGADPGVIAIAPVGEIVARFGARVRVIGDFVSGNSGFRGALLGQFEQGRRRVGIERFEGVLCDHRGEAGAGFDRQLIKREMLGAVADGAGKIGVPASHIVARQRVNQVEADAFYGVLRGFECPLSLGGAVRAA